MRLVLAVLALLLSSPALASTGPGTFEETVLERVKRNPWDFPKFEFHKQGLIWNGFLLERAGEYFDIARAKGWKKEFTYKSKKVVFDYQRIRYGGKVIFDGRASYEHAVKEQLLATQEETTPRGPIEAHGYLPFSLIGSVLTYGLTEADGDPKKTSLPREWASIDLDTGKAPSLLKFVDEESLISALKRHPCIRGSVPAKSLAKARKYFQIRKYFEASERKQSSCRDLESFDSIAFMDYDAKKDLVGLRIGYLNTNGNRHAMTAFIDLKVKPKKSFRSALIAARKGQGFMIGDYRKWR